MKRLLPALAAACAIFLACNQEPAKAPHSTAAPAGSGAPSGRAQRIEAYQRLRTRLSATEARAFATILTFPVPDTVMGVFVEDDSYQRRFHAAGNRIDRGLFEDYFPQIAQSLGLAELQNLFRQIPAEKLERLDSVHTEAHDKTAPCYTFYEAVLSGDTLVLFFGSDDNEAYEPPKDAEGEEFCEYAAKWTFRFDGKEFRLVNVFQAG